MVDHFARPEYPRTDRANGRYHRRGDLLISQTVEFTTHDCYSMRRRQRLERRIHREPNIVGERYILWCLQFPQARRKLGSRIVI
jgi:hypothetical protein